MKHRLLTLFIALAALLPASFAVAAGSKTATANTVTVELQTSQGRIVLELNARKAPKSVENFLAYARSGFYNGVIFHRVIPGFMIQGGGFTPDMAQKTSRAPIENEAKNGLKNKRGTIAMARTSDPHSASAQFFINLVDNDNLDYPSFDGWGYAVFGKVVEGMEVVDKIAAVDTGNVPPHQNVPKEPIIIQSTTILSEK
ncbi:MAG: peptidyl-prolyl cis-trans isomerase [Zoogloeaceae bacterium]|jgi:peptidyl-prolyl cis-trans isomerase A (cyclophilin A)|nr:peptidyl-prolyl cis-trans isomerase [Zoogloeaceae bacterium]